MNLSGLHIPGRPVFSATHALSVAFHDTVDLLLKPMDAGRWVKLSIVCLFLGGGTPSAAFDWSLGILPGDIGLPQFMGRVRESVAAHVWLIVLVSFSALAVLGLTLYLRATLRFVLVDAIARRQVNVRQALRETRRLGRSYFGWLLVVIVIVGFVLLGGGILAYPALRSGAAVGSRSAGFWTMLVAVLMVDILIGLTVALIIVLTDDFVVPIMYANRMPLGAAWRQLLPAIKAEPGAFAIYVVVRFGVALATSIATLFLLFPILVGLFSGAMISGALVVLALHFLGVSWTWNPLTVSLTAGGFGIVISLVLAVLSFVGMPAQVLIQDFGIRFIAAFMPSVQGVLQVRPPDDILIPEGELPDEA